MEGIPETSLTGLMENSSENRQPYQPADFDQPSGKHPDIAASITADQR